MLGYFFRTRRTRTLKRTVMMMTPQHFWQNSRRLRKSVPKSKNAK